MNQSPSKQQGVMLLEALLGLLIFSIGILALVAMQSTAVAQMRDAQYRSQASMMSERLMTVMTIEGSSSSANVTAVKNEITAALPSGAVTITEASTTFGANVLSVNIDISWQAPGSTSTSHHVTAGLLNYNQ